MAQEDNMEELDSWLDAPADAGIPDALKTTAQRKPRALMYTQASQPNAAGDNDKKNSRTRIFTNSRFQQQQQGQLMDDKKNFSKDRLKEHLTAEKLQKTWDKPMQKQRGPNNGDRELIIMSGQEFREECVTVDPEAQLECEHLIIHSSCCCNDERVFGVCSRCYMVFCNKPCLKKGLSYGASRVGLASQSALKRNFGISWEEEPQQQQAQYFPDRVPFEPVPFVPNIAQSIYPNYNPPIPTPPVSSRSSPPITSVPRVSENDYMAPIPNPFNHHNGINGHVSSRGRGGLGLTGRPPGMQIRVVPQGQNRQRQMQDRVPRDSRDPFGLVVKREPPLDSMYRPRGRGGGARSGGIQTCDKPTRTALLDGMDAEVLLGKPLNGSCDKNDPRSISTKENPQNGLNGVIVTQNHHDDDEESLLLNEFNSVFFEETTIATELESSDTTDTECSSLSSPTSKAVSLLSIKLDKTSNSNTESGSV